MLKIGDNEVPLLKGGSADNIIYYDFREINYLSDSDKYHIIKKIKQIRDQHKKVQFVNANREIKNKIISLGLEKVIICI